MLGKETPQVATTSEGQRVAVVLERKEKKIEKKWIKKEKGNPLINHQATMIHLISLLLTAFEETRGGNKIGK